MKVFFFLISSLLTSAAENSTFLSKIVYQQVSKSENRNFLVAPFETQLIQSRGTTANLQIEPTNISYIICIKIRKEAESAISASRKRQCFPFGSHIASGTLATTSYFKARWSKPFLKFYTERGSFHRREEVAEVATLRHYSQLFNYHQSSETGAQFLELPLEGGASMVVVLPSASDPSLLDPEQQLEPEYVNVVLPKFKISASANLKIEVTEEGVNVAPSGAAPEFPAVAHSAPPKNPKNFVADRPFFFYIRIKDVIVFVGRVADP